MLATNANGQPAAAAYTRDQHGNYQPYGICVLTDGPKALAELETRATVGKVALLP
jgi:hypothetical protein